MTKTAALSIRIPEALKQAIEKAASEDRRSVASFVEGVLEAHLKEKGYLPK
ncbi:hypothetical protein [Rhizobium sp. P007]|uniref:hypothetical protein n=1 Tax=Rhizobium sp. P007 TaxID=285908 RepID=UPI00163C7611|nr:hypothetical protein [Rhizobium sp. P007]